MADAYNARRQLRRALILEQAAAARALLAALGPARLVKLRRPGWEWDPEPDDKQLIAQVMNERAVQQALARLLPRRAPDGRFAPRPSLYLLSTDVHGVRLRTENLPVDGAPVDRDRLQVALGAARRAHLRLLRAPEDLGDDAHLWLFAELLSAHEQPLSAQVSVAADGALLVALGLDVLETLARSGELPVRIVTGALHTLVERMATPAILERAAMHVMQPIGQLHVHTDGSARLEIDGQIVARLD